MGQILRKDRGSVLNIEGLQTRAHIDDGSGLRQLEDITSETTTRVGVSVSCAKGISTLGPDALCVWLLNGDGDLALEEQGRSVSVFEDVHLLNTHKIGWVFDIVHQVFIGGTALVINQVQSIDTSWVNDKARVHEHTEGVNGLGLTGPFVEDGLPDESELNDVAIAGCIHDFVTANGHWHKLSLESGCDHADFDIGADSFVGLHVEALKSVGTINFGDEVGMEADDNG